MFCAAFVMCCQVAVAQLNNRATPAAEMRDAVAEDVSQVGRERYRIGPGDVLEIRVLNRPQLSRDSIR
jgi:protein involved in polysaccharide export with SLBB domain